MLLEIISFVGVKELFLFSTVNKKIHKHIISTRKLQTLKQLLPSFQRLLHSQNESKPLTSLFWNALYNTPLTFFMKRVNVVIVFAQSKSTPNLVYNVSAPHKVTICRAEEQTPKEFHVSHCFTPQKSYEDIYNESIQLQVLYSLEFGINSAFVAYGKSRTSEYFVLLLFDKKTEFSI